MSYPTGIDDGAPVVAEHTIVIEAPADVVFATHVDVNRWAQWNDKIDQASTPGPLAPGVTFEWSSYGLEVPSTVYAVSAPREILWGGEASGITGVHLWHFDDLGSDRTRVTTRESWSGAPVLADLERAQRDLDNSLAAWLAALRAEVEHR